MDVKPDEQMLPAALEFLGEDQVMYASDYPHFDAKTPYSVKILVERADLTDTVKRKILADNAARIFKLN